MTVVFPRDVEARLAEIEAIEGMPKLEVVQEAVNVWTFMNAEERRMVCGHILQTVVARRLGGIR